MTAPERKSDLKLTGELWGVYHEDFEENWPSYNGTALYIAWHSDVATLLVRP